MNKPLISLITVVYNGEQLLSDTLLSAINQTYKNIELVIIDGGSKDKTVEIAQTFSTYIGTLISEPDKGIYDAMNKGIAASKGEWLYFLNAGDALYDNRVLEDLFSERELDNYDFVYAKVQSVNEPTGVNYLIGREVDFKDFYFSYPLCHQSIFTRKQAFLNIGLFNANLKILADNEWQIRFFKNYPDKALFIDRIVAFYDIQGTSYHKRMQGYREFITYTRLHLPIYIFFYHIMMYPAIYLKVKFIRTFQHTGIFKFYRRVKFRNRKAIE